MQKFKSSIAEEFKKFGSWVDKKIKECEEKQNKVNGAINKEIANDK